MRKRKALIGRTGKKQKQARDRLATKAAQLDEADNPAVAAAAEPQLALLSEDDEFRSYKIISRAVESVIESLVTQLEKDQPKLESDRLWHAMHRANAIACA